MFFEIQNASQENSNISISLQANYKIQAAKLYYEVYSLSQRLRLTTIRVEHEESVRCYISDRCRSFFICSHLQLSTTLGQVKMFGFYLGLIDDAFLRSGGGITF